jgi:hypothetical protein
MSLNGISFPPNLANLVNSNQHYSKPVKVAISSCGDLTGSSDHAPLESLHNTGKKRMLNYQHQRMSYLSETEMRSLRDSNVCHLSSAKVKSMEWNSDNLEVDENTLFDLLNKPCCTEMCLKTKLGGTKFNLEPAKLFLFSVRSRIIAMSDKERGNMIREKVRECVQGVTYFNNRLRLDFKLGSARDLGGVKSVCRMAFCSVYGISVYRLKKAVSEIKGNVESTEGDLNDTSPVSEETLREVKEMVKYNKYELSSFEIANLICANTEVTMQVSLFFV